MSVRAAFFATVKNMSSEFDEASTAAPMDDRKYRDAHERSCPRALCKRQANLQCGGRSAEPRPDVSRNRQDQSRRCAIGLRGAHGGPKMNIMQLGMTPARLSPLMASILGALLICTLSAAYFAFRSIVFPLAIEPISKSEWRPPTAVNVASAVSVLDRSDTQTLTRPIFSKSRRPSARDAQQTGASAAAAPAAPLPTGLSLKAIVVRGKEKSAFIVCDSFPDGKWLKEGEALQSWTITAMHSLDVILTNGDNVSQLSIDYSEKGLSQPETPISGSGSDPDFIRDAKGRRG
jgi:hypothetical protein